MCVSKRICAESRESETAPASCRRLTFWWSHGNGCERVKRQSAAQFRHSTQAKIRIRPPVFSSWLACFPPDNVHATSTHSSCPVAYQVLDSLNLAFSPGAAGACPATIAPSCGAPSISHALECSDALLAPCILFIPLQRWIDRADDNVLTTRNLTVGSTTPSSTWPSTSTGHRSVVILASTNEPRNCSPMP